MKTFDSFVDRHTGLNSPEDLREMLATIGVGSVEELLQQVIPQSQKQTKPLPKKEMATIFGLEQ